MVQSIKHWLHNYEDPRSGPQNPHRKPHALDGPRMAIGGRDSWISGNLRASRAALPGKVLGQQEILSKQKVEDS